VFYFLNYEPIFVCNDDTDNDNVLDSYSSSCVLSNFIVIRHAFTDSPYYVVVQAVDQYCLSVLNVSDNGFN